METIIKQQIEVLASTLTSMIKDSRITKREIATKTDLSINTVINCLKGKSMNFKSLLKICYALGMNLEDLVKAATKNFPVVTVGIKTISSSGIQSAVDDGQSKDQVEWRMGKDSDDAEEKSDEDKLSTSNEVAEDIDIGNLLEI